MNRKSVLSCILRTALGLFAATLLFGVGPLQAQVDTGTILGTVKDTSGGSINGATVTLTNEGTDASLSLTTGSDGGYKFSPLKIGSYKVSASAAGFETLVQVKIAVNVGADVVIDFTLKPGQTTQTIEVTAAPPVLETQSGSVGQIVDQHSVDTLPLNGRNFTFLAQLAAGVNTPQADTRGNAASGAFSANGNRPAQNNYLLDGIDNNSDTVDFLNGTNFVVLPPVDAIEEFKVQTSDFSAEFGRSGAAVLNASIKSGTNQLHGTIWEFFRNDKLDAADFFENANNIGKGELRQNQFGFSAGGPVVIPKVFNGRNKVFFFGDYEGLRRVQGTVATGTVPTLAEKMSGYTNLSDLITNPNLLQTDALGRTLPTGTILDPATTRQVIAGGVDPLTGLMVPTSAQNPMLFPAAGTVEYVRDPFGTCAPTTMAFTPAACGLNHIPMNRLDMNAVNLLNLYPNPTTGSVFNNFGSSPNLFEHRNAFDTRLDINFTQKDTVFYRFSLADDPQFIPSIFGGVADGGAFQQGNQTAIAQQSALGYTHTFSPTLVNVARVGFNYLHTTRSAPEASNLTDVPGMFGIQGVPQTTLNGGLPQISITGLSTIGGNGFLPSDEVSSTLQLTDDVTKIYGKHTFKMGFEYQRVKFSTLQPPYSRGDLNFSGLYTEIPGVGSGNTGRAQFLLTPTLNSVGAPYDFVGGPSGGNDDGQAHNNSIQLSNTALTDDGKNYFGGYFNDDWKITKNLTLNLGLRYDFFGLVFEHHSAQANFIPAGGPMNGPTYLVPAGTSCSPGVNLSDGPNGFTTLLAADGIACLSSNAYGGGLGHSQKANFSPRLGFAYQVSPKLVVRGGFGIFYNGFENRGYSPNLSENYPYQFSFGFGGASTVFSPTIFSGGCPAGAAVTPINSATLETGFSCTPLSSLVVNASGLALRGIQFDYQTPYTLSGNLTLQYQLTPTMSVQAGYVTSLGRHLEVFPGSNEVSQILPANLPAGESTANFVPFPDFGQGANYGATEGNSIYHGLQTKVEKQFGGGLNFLATYTFSKVRTDAIDLLNNSRGQGYRAPYVPGFGIQGDYGLADFDIRNVFHLSGGYQLPFGKGKHFMTDASGAVDKLVGGWSIITIVTLQDGQPFTLSCPSGTTSGTGCYAILVKGQSPKLGLHTDSNGELSWIGNPAAFTQPPPCTGIPGGAETNCGLSALGGSAAQIVGPGFHRMDFSIFKEIPVNERIRFQFRTEIFNITNHPNFNSPNFGGNGVVAISGSGNFTSSNFGEIGATRDAPYDARQIQFALKLYY